MKRYCLFIVAGYLCGCLLYLPPWRASAEEVKKTPGQWPVLPAVSIAGNGTVPEGWELQRHRGEPVVTGMMTEGSPYLRMASRGDTAFGIKKEMTVDLREFPYLNWQWRVNRFPRGGDIRRADKDDQALQIYLLFGVAGLGVPTLSYIWDSEAPKGLVVKSPQRWLERVRYVVIRNGNDSQGRWYREKRLVALDSRNAFCDLEKSPSLNVVRGVLIFINTHHTKDEAEADIGNIYFSRE